MSTATEWGNSSCRRSSAASPDEFSDHHPLRLIGQFVTEQPRALRQHPGLHPGEFGDVRAVERGTPARKSATSRPISVANASASSNR